MWLAAYPEIHYRIPFLPSLYYRKEPEIVFDCANRLVDGRPFKLALLIKDAHRFPLTVEKVEIAVNGRTVFRKNVRRRIDSPLYQEIFTLEIADNLRKFQVVPSISFRRKKRLKTIYFHNFALVKSPLKIQRVAPKPQSSQWLAGDVHYHSHYTSDQVEFGAPLKMACELAQNIGLDWLAVTDHSYDLDDMPDNYLKNDPALPKWQALKAEIAAETKDGFTFLLGEEISAGNHRRHNVHLLNLGDAQFFPGSGDSAEKWFRNYPDLAISQIANQSGGLLVAAHPFSKVPLLQKWTLRRGCWEEADLRHVSHVQIANGDMADFIRSRNIWLQYLRNGFRLFPLAGNDAHGNFYAFRQIHVPMLRLTEKFHQMPGIFQTGVFADKNNSDNILAAIGMGNSFITTGPFLRLKADFFLEMESNETYGKIRKIVILTDKETVQLDDDRFGRVVNITKHLRQPFTFLFAEIITEKGRYAMSNIYFCDS